jgi:hypothetical protein
MKRTWLPVLAIASACSSRPEPVVVAAPPRMADAGVDVAPFATIEQPAVDRVLRAELAAVIARVRGTTAPRALTKDLVRPTMKQLVPHLGACYEQARQREPTLGGVFNLDIRVDSEPGYGTIVTVRGFDTAGAIGRSDEFRDCATVTLGALVLPPIANGGSLDLIYPLTFATEPPDNRDAGVLARARNAVAQNDWRTALAHAERGLERTSLDGTIRRPLIEIAGLAACNLRLVAKARHYVALAPAQAEPAVRAACKQSGVELR